MKDDMEKIRTAASHNATVTKRRITAGSQCFVAALQVKAGVGIDEIRGDVDDGPLAHDTLPG